MCIHELKKMGFELDVDIVDTEQAFSARVQSLVYDLTLSECRFQHGAL